MENLSRSLAVEWAELGLRVNCVAPGSSIYSPTAEQNYGQDLSPFQLARPGIPAKRLGSTREVRDDGGIYPSAPSLSSAVPALSLSPLGSY